MITPADVAEILGRPTPSTNDATYRQWQRWITNALLLLRSGDGVHDGLGDLAALDQDLLDYVVLEAVKAQVQRPDDATQVEVAVDDGRVSKTYQSSPGRVSIRDEWWAMLSPAELAAGAFSIRPSFQPDDLNDLSR